MNWLRFLLIVFLFLCVVSFQMNQNNDYIGMFCENPFLTTLDWANSYNKDFKFKNWYFDIKPIPCFLNPIYSFFQGNNLLTLFPIFFKGTSPFWRSPPSFLL